MEPNGSVIKSFDPCQKFSLTVASLECVAVNGRLGGSEMSDLAVGVIERERTGAGQDPRKREQILDGARKLFLAEGFDAASMGDIARAAGVSKGTLYVYFDSKEGLFAELVREGELRQANAIFALDLEDPDVRAVLTRLGRAFVRFVTAPKSIQAVRGVIAVAQRLPELGSDFYRLGPRACTSR